MRSFPAFLCCALFTLDAYAQAPAPAAPTLLVNGTFTAFKAADNIWDGINNAGAVAGFQRSAYAVTEKGPPGNVALPITVNWMDMNGDAVSDLVTCDPFGCMRIYFNSGTPAEPKFTVAETVPIFLARPARDDAPDVNWSHGAPKIALFDSSKRGVPDLYVGNYSGQVMMLRNAGSASSPNFEQPATYAKAAIPTTTKGQLWGNLFAPYVIDWNRDGKADLLLGEGSYSANAVHLLLNDGTSMDPKYTEEKRYYLCYGDGREHLTPTVVDYNGDGLLDVLTGTRSGTVAVHLQEPGWKPGTELRFAKLITFGSTEALGAAVCPCAADYNGDGLFDLLIGRSDGKVQVSINEGTKTEPKFGKAVDVKGADLWKMNVFLPTGWSVNTGEGRGNFFGCVSTIAEKSPSGGNLLRMSYWPPPNKIMKMVPHVVKGTNDKDFFHSNYYKWSAADAGTGSDNKPTNSFSIRQTLKNLQNNATYTLKFKARGNKFEAGLATVAALGVVDLEVPKKTRKGRGLTITVNQRKEEYAYEQAFMPSGSWTSYSKTFTISFQAKELKALTAPTAALIEFKTFLAPYDGVCEISDVELVASR
jgi:hypothetical protein